MADELYLNLWFTSFSEPEMFPRMVSVLQQFPFSVAKPGVTYASVRPLGWSEPTILERKFQPGVSAEELASVLEEFAKSDYAWELTAAWDLWLPVIEGDLDPRWELQPQTVQFLA